MSGYSTEAFPLQKCRSRADFPRQYGGFSYPVVRFLPAIMDDQTACAGAIPADGPLLPSRKSESGYPPVLPAPKRRGNGRLQCQKSQWAEIPCAFDSALMAIQPCPPCSRCNSAEPDGIFPGSL